MGKVVRIGSTKTQVVDITRRRREAMDLVKFIGAHDGRLGAFRGYGAALQQVPAQPGDATGAADTIEQAKP